jgi:hypothetical protein
LTISRQAGWLNQTSLFVNDWAIRIVVLCSFTSHLILALFAGIRRRQATGVRAVILWLAYQIGGWAGTYALGSMSLSRTTQQQQQQLALWAPFLLLHLAGPDNITAYSLEDTVLAGRQMLTVAVQIIGAAYVLYKQIYSSTAGAGSAGGALMWFSVVMFIVGVAKYVERALAMRQADLGNMRSSSKKSKLERRRFFSDVRELGNEHALLVAHDLLYITKGAFVDHLDDEHPLDREAVRSGIFHHGWKEMLKVVDMELSLMYDILYTKAAVVHTWFGYSIRAVSPVISTTMLLLFWLHGKDQQRRADVFITYILMASTVFLDIRWLLRAVVSTWTYVFLIDRPCCWLHHRLPARWRVLRHFVLSLDPCRLLVKEEPTWYRMWSGTIGQYNLLHECTHDTVSMFSSLVKKVASDDHWMEYEYHYSRGIHISEVFKENLFDCIWKFMKLAYRVVPEKEDRKKGESCGARVESVRELEEALDFLPEFQESILILHIAMHVFYLCTESDQNAASSKQLVKAIKTLSDYMVFLVAVCPGMLPGLKLRSFYEATRFALEKIWSDKRSSCNSTRSTREKCLVNILRAMEEEEGETVVKNLNNWRQGYRTRNWKPDFISKLYNSSIILSDGIKLAELMLRWLRTGYRDFRIPHTKSEKKSEQMFPELMKIMQYKMYNYPTDDKMRKLLECIFAEWVRLLINASVKCTRDSHAKQLSRGGELTSVVWILVEHAGIFRVDCGRSVA